MFYNRQINKFHGRETYMKNRRIFCVICILSFLSFQLNAFEKYGDEFLSDWSLIGSIKTQNLQETYKVLSQEDIDIAGVDYKQKIIDVLLSENDFERLKKRGYSIQILETKGVSRAPDTQYKNPDEINEILNDYALNYPDITKKVSIGKSVEGRDIWALKISDNPEINELDEPTILFNSMHHAREIMTPEVTLDIIESLLKGHHINETYTNWINRYQIWIIPMLNVDGNHKMWTKDKWWRKNNRGGYGVDLNRNYPATWKKCRGSSGWRSSQTYRGPKPASEPETQAMMSFVQKIRPVFDISYHSYSELVIYPMGCSPERTKNKDVVEKIGKEIAQKINYTPGTAWELLYNADGGDIDWMYEAYQVIPYVIEVNSRSEGFHPDYNLWRDKTVKRNRPGWKHLLTRLSGPGIRGVVTKGTHGFNDYWIDVYKQKGGEKLLSYKAQDTGVYHLVLNSGQYYLEFRNDQHIFAQVYKKITNKLLIKNIEL